MALAAWDEVGAWLMTTWAAAGAVLVAAGWGIYSLVSLTGRRLQFAYAVTHELRTPLTTFQLYSDMLSSGLVPEGSRQEYLDTLNRESRRLSSLVQDVLEYARLENHKVRLTPTRLDGQSLAKRLGEELEARCKDNGFRSEVLSEIPQREEVVTDVDLLAQVVNVLVNNACRHAAPKNGSTNHEEIQPKVLLHLSADNGHVHVSVIDTGPGVDRLDSRDIFKPFRRGRNADAKAQGGIGLGLALARTWAELLNGRLELASRHHATYGGAHFRLTIPSRIEG
jgi:signal transduction histidine kinase